MGLSCSRALVQDVTAGGPADKAGIKNGDVIRKLNGQTVESNSQLTAMVTNMNPGTQVSVDLIRDGQPMTVQVRLGERPSNLGSRPVREGLQRKGRYVASRCRTSRRKSASSWVWRRVRGALW